MPERRRGGAICSVRTIMKSFTAGHISEDRATSRRLQRGVAPFEVAEIGGSVEFVPGVSYRNVVIIHPESDDKPLVL